MTHKVSKNYIENLNRKNLVYYLECSLLKNCNGLKVPGYEIWQDIGNFTRYS